MNTEEKAKAYDEALKKAKMYHQNAKEADDYSAVARYENVFPELAESEDERIRKAIKCYVEDMPDTYGFAHGIGKKEMLSYLEKQKEQKPVDVDLDNASQDYVYNHFCSGADFTPDYIKGLMEDAFVDGANWQREQTPGITEKNPINPFDTKLFQDGVKEGRRLEREDMQKEQKPASGDSEKPNTQWSEDFEENIGNLLHDKLTWHSEDGSMSSTVLIDDKTLKDIIQGIWFYVGKEVLKYPNKKLNVTEWSEENEKIRRNLMSLLVNMRGDRITEETYQKYYPWLKSLHPQPKQKDRYQEGFQDGVYEGRRRAWEEYNKSVAFHYGDFNHKLSCYEGGPCTNPHFDCLNCPRNGNSSVKTYTSPNITEYQSWKPSEEQMRALKEFVEEARGIHNASMSGYTPYLNLNSLLEVLLKLM